MPKCPPRKLQRETLTRLDTDRSVHVIPKSTSIIDKLKYKICEIFIVYKNSHTELSQAEFAEYLGIDQAIMSKVLHYQITSFTVDRLLGILSILHGKDIKIDIKADKRVYKVTLI